MESTSTEIAIHPYKHKDGAFSAPGDSENIIFDGLGRIVDLLIGGSVAVARLNSTDVTYDMPYFWIEEQIKKAFPYSYLYPIKEYGRDIDTTTSGTPVRHLVPFSLNSPYLTSSLPVMLLCLLVSCQCRRGGLFFRFVSFFLSHLFV